MKKILLILVVMSVMVVETYADLTGRCGGDVKWTLNETTGQLTIYGLGKMDNFGSYNNPFKELPNVKSVVVEEGVTSLGVNFLYNQKSLTSVSLPSSLMIIGDNAFSDCEELSSVAIPNKLEVIGARAFERCAKLKSLDLPASLMKIGSYAFCGCESLEKIDIPNSVRTLNEHTFEGCKSLRSVRLPANIETIPLVMFKDCESLQSIVIPEGVINVYPNAFENCMSLASVEIPNSVTYISSGVFKDCKSLKTIRMPESMLKLDYAAFEGCDNLTSIILETQKPPIVYATTFSEGIFSTCNLSIPYGAKEAYQNSSIWKDFLNVNEYHEEGLVCAKPTISYNMGEIRFACETPGAEIHYTLYAYSATDERTAESSETISINMHYKIAFYATAPGYSPSKKVYAQVEMDRFNFNGDKVYDADINGDYRVNAADVVGVYDYIINGGGTTGGPTWH